jgi:hypothetical protein
VIAIRIAWIGGVIVFCFVVYLAIRGVTAMVPLVVTAVVLVAMIAGGNLVSGGRPSYGRSAPAEEETPAEEGETGQP